jgi:mRNA interferase MazF
MKQPLRGEVWIVDLGYNAKTRPCLILSVSPLDLDRALATLVLHTTQVRGTRFEVAIPARFLRPGAFDAQDIQTVALAKVERKLGSLTENQLKEVEDAVLDWLGL